MDRILILMAAANYADAQTALNSALENAAVPAALSFGLTLLNEPGVPSEQAMADLGRVQFLCPADDPWAAMPYLWQGEGYVLMAHPAMRFTSGWDKALLRQWHACTAVKRKQRPPLAERIREFINPEESAPEDIAQPIRSEEPAEVPAPPADQHVLTGYLPVREDPLDAVCPVGADALNLLGELTFRHGVPLRYTVVSPQGPFLHPDFCFGPAGFFRAMAEAGDAPLFLRAFRGQWGLYTPVKPVIRLVWDLPVAPCSIDPESDGMADFAQTYGIDLANCALSPQSRRGMLSEELNFRLRVPLSVKLRHSWRHSVQRRRQNAKKYPEPLCVTLYTGDMPLETQRWLKRLAELKHLPLLAYVEPLLVREITAFLPNVRELRPRYLMELPIGTAEEKRLLSKAAILANARDRELTPSHHVWMDPDCVQYPLYADTAFDWEQLCTDKIVLAMVNGEPDLTMFVVPERLMLTLAREIEARCLTFINQRGDLPTETELWSILLREHPDWFHLQTMPVKRQLFTLLDAAD